MVLGWHVLNGTEGVWILAHYSLVRRFVLGAILWSASLLIIIAFLLSWIYRQAVYRGFDDTLEGTTSVLIAFTETSSVGDIIHADLSIDARYQTAFSGYYWVIASLEADNRIVPLSQSRSLYEGKISVSTDIIKDISNQPGLIRHFTGDGPFGEPLRIVARSVFLPDRTESVIVLAAADRRPVDKTVQRFSMITSWTLTAFAIGLIFVVVFQVRLGLSPLFQLKQAIANIRNGQVDHVLGQYPVEVKPLVDELNSLISHNRDIVERARTHVGNLAHGLKTPLSVLTNEAYQYQKTAPPLADIVQRQAGIMARQLDHHLNKARAAAHAKNIGLKTHIPGVIDDLIRAVKKIYRYRPIALNYQKEKECFFRGEKQDFEEMIGNLLDNACKWARHKVEIRSVCIEKADLEKEFFSEWEGYLTNQGGRDNRNKITKELKEKAESFSQTLRGTLCVKILVEDDGPGLPEEYMETVLKRGERLDERQPGSGLGLSIVNDLSRDYGGRLILKRSSMGGLKAILLLPALV